MQLDEATLPHRTKIATELEELFKREYAALIAELKVLFSSTDYFLFLIRY